MTTTITVQAHYNSHIYGWYPWWQCKKLDRDDSIHYFIEDGSGFCNHICEPCAEQLMPELADIYLPENEDGERTYDVPKAWEVLGKIMPVEDLAEHRRDHDFFAAALQTGESK